jgi:hypothetical protein
MHGNVDEWCEDVWHRNYEGAPADGSAWLAGEESDPFRVVRGGWASATEFVCTSAARRQLRADAASPVEDDGDEGDDDGFMSMLSEMMYTPYGMRLVCEC